MDEMHEALSSVRRDLRRLEDDQAQLNRKKANNDDVEVVAKKQSDMESENRAKLQTIQSELHTLNGSFNKMVQLIEGLSEDLSRHKRKTATELEEIQTPAKDGKPGRAEKPFLPMQLQITLYILAGVGLMALIQNAPAAMRTIPNLHLGG